MFSDSEYNIGTYESGSIDVSLPHRLGSKLLESVKCSTSQIPYIGNLLDAHEAVFQLSSAALVLSGLITAQSLPRWVVSLEHLLALNPEQIIQQYHTKGVINYLDLSSALVVKLPSKIPTNYNTDLFQALNNTLEQHRKASLWIFDCSGCSTIPPLTAAQLLGFQRTLLQRDTMAAMVWLRESALTTELVPRFTKDFGLKKKGMFFFSQLKEE